MNTKNDRNNQNNHKEWSECRTKLGDQWTEIMVEIFGLKGIGAIVISASLLFVKLFEQIKEDGNQLISEAEIYHSISETSCPL